MKIKINFPTGNWFKNGDIEIGTIWEEEVATRKELDNLLDEIQEGVSYFITDDNGNKIDTYELFISLDEDDEKLEYDMDNK